MEEKIGGKSIPRNIYKEGSSPHFIIFRISNFSLLLELLSRVTCCLERVLQANSSPFLRGTLSATLERFTFILLEEDFIVVSNSCIHLQVVRISGGHSEGMPSLFVASCRGILVRRTPERRHRSFVSILESYGARGECSHSV